MSDGVILRADVSYPTDPATGERATGTFPVLLTQTPYLGTPATQGDYFVQRGYIFVTAYVRGTTTSGGDFLFFSDRDAKDGAELVQWAATKLQNTNGTVGLWGGSYGGITQIFTVAELGPNSPVKAIAPYCMGAEFYRETYFAGGVPTQTLNFQRVIGDAMGGTTAPTGASFVSDVTSGKDRALFTDFWSVRTPGNLAQKVADADVPTLLWSTNGDIYAQSSLELYAYLQNAYAKRPVFGAMAVDQNASGRYQVIIGQGGHCESIDQRISLEWYDTWLKGADTGIADTALPLHVHELGSNRWVNTGTYPPVPTYTQYFLAPKGKLDTAAQGSDAEEKIAWAQPGENSTLQYESPVLENGGSLAGPIGATLYASTDKTNLELIATLEVVNPDGTVLPVSAGTLLGSMSANDPDRSWVDTNGVATRPYGKFTADEPLEPGKVGEYNFLVSPRFVAMVPGSRLRLTVTTQTPTDKCSPVLGTDPCFPTAVQEAGLKDSTTTLHYGPEHRSAINLPLLPAHCWVSADNPGIPFWNSDPEVSQAPCQTTSAH